MGSFKFREGTLVNTVDKTSDFLKVNPYSAEFPKIY